MKKKIDESKGLSVKQRERKTAITMMLDHYQQTKNMLVSYSPKALGFF